MKKRVRAVWGACIALVCTACAEKKPAIPPSRFLAWSHQAVTPKCICVLPFGNKTGQADVAEQVRKSFAGHLSIKRFADAELYDIDAKLPPNWEQIPAEALGKTLGCQALVYGIVTKANRLYLGLYSGISLDGGILLIDTKTGQPLLEKSYATRFRDGDLPLSLIGIVPSAVMTLRNVTDVQMLRAIDDLGRNLASSVPDLPDPLDTQTLPSSTPQQETLPTPVVAASEPPRVSVPQSTNATNAKNAKNASSDSYRLQVGAFRSSDEAVHAVQLLREKGYQPEITASLDIEKRWHRVVIGPFPSVASAAQVGAAIQHALPFSPIVKVSSAP